MAKPLDGTFYRDYSNLLIWLWTQQQEHNKLLGITQIWKKYDEIKKMVIVSFPYSSSRDSGLSEEDDKEAIDWD